MLVRRERKGKSEVGVGGWARDIVVGWEGGPVPPSGQANLGGSACH